jgi:hypothetical protein
VRTVDDALIRIKLMIFYELKDIETMVGTDFKVSADIYYVVFSSCCDVPN